MTVNKGLLAAVAVLLLVLLAGALVAQGRIAGLKADLTAQTSRAERAEEKVTALESASAYRETQIHALQGIAAQCEEARSREAANAAERRAILSQARDGQSPIASRERARVDSSATPKAAQGGIASPQISKPQENPHDATRRAVADRLNRPL